MLVRSIHENRPDLLKDAIEHPEVVDQRDQSLYPFRWVLVLLLDSFQTLLPSHIRTVHIFVLLVGLALVILLRNIDTTVC